MKDIWQSYFLVILIIIVISTTIMVFSHQDAFLSPSSSTESIIISLKCRDYVEHAEYGKASASGNFEGCSVYAGNQSLAQVKCESNPCSGIKGYEQFLANLKDKAKKDAEAKCNAKLSSVMFKCPENEKCPSGQVVPCPLTVNKIACEAFSYHSVIAVGGGSRDLWYCNDIYSATAEGSVIGACGGCAEQ